jgi:hypothetical protein
MKYCLVLSVFILSLAACSNPSLKWIGASEDSTAGFSEVFFRITDPDLLPPNPYLYSGVSSFVVVEIPVNLNSSGTGAPYSDPQWRLDGELCNNSLSGDISTGFGGQFYLVSYDATIIYINTTSLVPGAHEVDVTVTGRDGNHYTDRVTVLVNEN